MSEPKLENDCGLIIDPAVLADIRAQCERRRRELKAAGTLPPATIAPGASQSASSAAPASTPMSEAERFGAAVPDMPPRIRAFFEREDPTPPQQPESTQERLEREARACF